MVMEIGSPGAEYEALAALPLCIVVLILWARLLSAFGCLRRSINIFDNILKKEKALGPHGLRIAPPNFVFDFLVSKIRRNFIFNGARLQDYPL